MNQLQRAAAHLACINAHKIKVTELCIRCGLVKQGLLHDLSKYSWCELKTGFKYYQGNRSPIDAQKEDIGYSYSWLHHKGRNPHHWEFWIDLTPEGLAPVPMPVNYVVEMFCDRVAACMIYQKDKYTDASALEYYMRGRKRIMIHPETDALIMELLVYLKDHGLNKTIAYIRRCILTQQ
jgi:hypothetical protein